MSTSPASTQLDPIAIYRETVQPLYAFVARRAEGERQLAEDVTQETYLRFIAECKRNKQPRNTLPWLQTVAHNLLMDHYRRSNSNRQPGPVDPASLDRMLTTEGPSPEAATRAVLWGLAKIKPHWATLVASFHLDGKSVAAIAAETNQSERAVEGQLRRARESLRTVLAAHQESNQ